MPRLDPAAGTLVFAGPISGGGLSSAGDGVTGMSDRA
jgi:hypothetical protein